MNIDRNFLKKISNKAIDYTVDAIEAVLDYTPVAAKKIGQRTGPHIAKGAYIVTKKTMDTLYKLAFK